MHCVQHSNVPNTIATLGYMLEKVPDGIDHMVLHAIVRAGKPEVLWFAASHLGSRGSWTDLSPDGETLLMAAMRYPAHVDARLVDIVRFLLDHGVDPHVPIGWSCKFMRYEGKPEKGDTPVHQAAKIHDKTVRARVLAAFFEHGAGRDIVPTEWAEWAAHVRRAYPAMAEALPDVLPLHLRQCIVESAMGTSPRVACELGLYDQPSAHAAKKTSLLGKIGKAVRHFCHL